MSEEGSVYDAVGGERFFVDLVDRFYDGVATDVLLRPLYPEDLTAPRRHLALFLAQYWGGPSTYSDERGHPRLRMRHAPFVIGDAERDAWLRHMLASLDAVAAERGTPGAGGRQDPHVPRRRRAVPRQHPVTGDRIRHL